MNEGCYLKPNGSKEICNYLIDDVNEIDSIRQVMKTRIEEKLAIHHRHYIDWKKLQEKKNEGQFGE